VSSCRALLVSAPASGQGKTTVTAALARRARTQGLRVRVFKTGPDFLDPMLLEAASGGPVDPLDLWMVGEAQCRALLQEAARTADLILVEGVMGLHDGRPSSADLAQCFGLPVLAVIDGAAMAQTFGAIALGLARYRDGLRFHGVIANRVGSVRHAQMLAASLPPSLLFLGALPRNGGYALPERHLGLLQAGEIADLDARLDAAAAALGESVDFASIPQVAFGEPTQISPQAGEGYSTAPPRLDGLRIGVARDAAFAFLYRANLELLATLGARLEFFSPLADRALPDVDALYLPGGYPELHAARLAANAPLLAALRTHHAAGKPIVAECGGMMPLFEALTDGDGRRHEMAGLLAGETAMQPRLQGLAMQSVDLGDGSLRGHAFHYSRLSTPLEPAVRARTKQGEEGEPLFRDRGLTASYIHFYLPSNPHAAARLFQP